MNTNRRVLAAASALAIGATIAGALPAHAIERRTCASGYLYVKSNQTTCWANAGTKSVRLYLVYGINSGNNAGYVDGYSDCAGARDITKFAKWANGPVVGEVLYGCTDTINTVHIN